MEDRNRKRAPKKQKKDSSEPARKTDPETRRKKKAAVVIIVDRNGKPSRPDHNMGNQDILMFANEAKQLAKITFLGKGVDEFTGTAGGVLKIAPGSTSPALLPNHKDVTVDYQIEVGSGAKKTYSIEVGDGPLEIDITAAGLSPVDASIQQGGSLFFQNDTGVAIQLDFDGDKALKDEFGRDINPLQKFKNGARSDTFYGDGADQEVTYTSKPSKKKRVRTGNGTIKVGQT